MVSSVRRKGGLRDYMTVREASALLGVSPSTLRNWDRKGKLKALRNPINRYRLYSREDLEAFLQKLSPRHGREK